MTLDEFIQKWLGKKCDADGFYGGQCVDLYRQYVKEVLGFPQSPGVGGAAEIWDSADPNYYNFIQDGANKIPSKGDIVIWNRKVGGGFGHVAVCVSASLSSSKFTSFDQNWPTLDKCTLTEHSYTNVIGWLHPKENMANELAECLEQRKSFWDQRDDLLRVIGAPDVETGKNMVSGLKSRITELTNQLGDAKAQATTAQDQLNIALDRAAKSEAQAKTLTDQVKTEQATIDQVVQAKGETMNQLVACQNQVATLQQGQAQGKYTFTLKQVWNLLWNGKITIEK